MDGPVDVAVVGAGLAGLTTAGELHRSGLTVRVFEARPRVGGRTLSISPEGLTGTFDLGATWVWSDQPSILSTVAELGIETFPQYSDGRHLAEDTAARPSVAAVAPLPAPALRIAGGTQQICDLLAARLPT
ncbi:MAG TPA: FAD-dependent oxidoreductase, partial [Acidimicrobiales bacterium]